MFLRNCHLDPISYPIVTVGYLTTVMFHPGSPLTYTAEWMRSVFTEIGVSPDGNSGSKPNFGRERKHYKFQLSFLHLVGWG